jgi:hypothetical protein
LVWTLVPRLTGCSRMFYLKKFNNFYYLRKSITCRFLETEKEIFIPNFLICFFRRFEIIFLRNLIPIRGAEAADVRSGVRVASRRRRPSPRTTSRRTRCRRRCSNCHRETSSTSGKVGRASKPDSYRSERFNKIYITK